MAFYSFRRDETVTAVTPFVTPGGDPSTYRSVTSQRRISETVTAVDPGPEVVPGLGFIIQAASTAIATSTIGPRPGNEPQVGKAYRSNETATAAEFVLKSVDSQRSQAELVTAVDLPRRFLNYYRRVESTATAADTLPVARLGKWYRSDETPLAVDTHAVSVGYGRIENEEVTAVDDVRISIRPRPGVGLVLHPFRNGTDQQFSLYPDAGEQAYEDVDDLIPDDDTTYVYNSSDPGEAVTFQVDPVLIPVASPHRITGIWLLLRVKGDGSAFTPRFRLHNRLYDGDELEPAGAAWQTFYTWWPQNVFGWRPWTASDLLDLEVGLANTSTVGISLTQVMVWVCTEPTPHRSLNLNVSGRFQEWTASTGDHPTYSLISDDADRSYISSTTPGDRQTVRSTENILMPEQFQIDKVQLTIRARGAGGDINPLVYEEGTEHPGPFNQGPWTVPVDDELDSLMNQGTWKSWTVPFYGRPRFTMGMTRWTLDNIRAAEWGVENVDSEDVQVSHVGLDIFASLRPESEHRLLPSADGYYQHWNIQWPNSGEQAYEDVNTYHPLDASFLRADATVTSKLVTFQVTNVLEANWYGVRWRARMRREPGTTARVRAAPLLRKNGVLYVGRPLEFTDYGSDEFVELVEDFWCNPFDGKPWEDDALQTIEIGVMLLEGRADLSWCVLEAGTVPPRVHGNDPWLCAFTDIGAANAARAVTDGLVWTVDRYQVGRGGYQYDNPAAIHPLSTSDTDLADPLYTGKVIKSHNVGYTAYYWVALPPGEFSDPIGELFLLARVVESANPADVVGSYFPLAVAHFPAGFHTLRSIRVLRVALVYQEPVPAVPSTYGSADYGTETFGG
jgi:hypothetical protein